MKWLKDGKRIVSVSPDFTVAISDISGSDKGPLVTKKEHEFKIFSVDVD
jgi:WD40 repeat protein